MVQPVAQQARAHGRLAMVQQREQGRRLLATNGLGQLQVAPGGRIQADEFILRFGRQAAHVLQAAALRRLGIAQQRAGSTECRAQAIGAKAGQRGHGQLIEQRLVAADDIEMPVRYMLGVGAAVIGEQVGPIGAQDFGRRNAFELLLQARANGAHFA